MGKVQNIKKEAETASAEAASAEADVPRTRQGRAYMECFHIKDFVRNDGSKGSSWTRVGFGFQNRDGSWSLELAATPCDGRIHMRQPRLREDGYPQPVRAAA